MARRDTTATTEPVAPVASVPSHVPAPAPAAPPPPPPILTTPNPARAELGVLARYPGFSTVRQIGESLVFGDGGPRFKVMDKDLLHGRDIVAGKTCNDQHVFGDRVLCAKSNPPVTVRIPSGEVEPYPFDDIVEVVHVGDAVALRRCPVASGHNAMLITILERDGLHGRDVQTSEPCNALHGVVGDALFYGAYTDSAPQWLMHVPSGVVEPYVRPASPAGDGRYHRPIEETVIGGARYTPFYANPDADGGLRDGLAAYDVASGKLLWRSLWGDVSAPVASEGTLVVSLRAALVELDPATGAVLWERGAAEGNGWSGSVTRLPGEVIAIYYGNTQTTPSELVLYKRGYPSPPAWTGKIHGTIRISGDAKHAGSPGMLTVSAGSARTKPDAQGHYELNVSSRGWVTVKTDDDGGAGRTVETKTFELQPGHGPYEVDLHLSYFEQACR